ncbi:MAG TPA: acetyl-CoA decarbonylase/synthase complex subunit delta [Thermodesulfobacteriaceae bacterium]|nr:acetyl-CoA decarbonylase/synthase complex subunit delta [Thermodesulfobacteriaceae bacterium]
MPAGIPPCPPELSPDEWKRKWVVRLTARGNVLLHKREVQEAESAFRQALKIDPGYEKARTGLERAGKREAVPEVPEEKPASPEAEKEVAPAVEVEELPEAPVPESEAAPPEEKKPEAKRAASLAVEAEGVEISTLELAEEAATLMERAGSIPQDMIMEPASGVIQEVVIGDGEKALTVGGSSALPFHLFEGDMPNSPRIAYEILDMEPEEWPEPLMKYYSDVASDPVAWAKKCVEEYGAEAICMSLVSTDPNGVDRPAGEAARVAQSVVDGVDVPVILWGCGNADKDTETLREVTNLTGSKKVCIGPPTDVNYRTLGATAMAFQLPVVAATPIDVNLAKQLNILLENLGMSLNQILMDPSIGAAGYGLEYTYSVMERIRLAALTQQDDKLQVPFICNLGREVWKAKECRLPSDPLMGDQERRGIMMEAVTASTLLLAGGELMVMRHPKAVSLTESLIRGMM